MRWFARRLVFYVFAIWVALTINFLLPRLMPGNPIGGVLQHLSPAQLAANPGLIADVPGAARGRPPLDLARLRRLPEPHRALQLRHLDVELPDAGLRGRRPHAAVLDLPRRRRVHLRVHRSAPRSGCSPRGGAAAFFDNLVVPAFMALGAFPAFFIALIGLYFLGLKLGWFPIQHAYDNDVTPGLNWPFICERVPPRAAADPRDHRRLRRRLGAEHAHRDDQHDRRGLRDDGATRRACATAA